MRPLQQRVKPFDQPVEIRVGFHIVAHVLHISGQVCGHGHQVALGQLSLLVDRTGIGFVVLLRRALHKRRQLRKLRAVRHHRVQVVEDGLPRLAELLAAGLKIGSRGDVKLHHLVLDLFHAGARVDAQLFHLGNDTRPEVAIRLNGGLVFGRVPDRFGLIRLMLGIDKEVFFLARHCPHGTAVTLRVSAARMLPHEVFIGGIDAVILRGGRGALLRFGDRSCVGLFRVAQCLQRLCGVQRTDGLFRPLDFATRCRGLFTQRFKALAATLQRSLHGQRRPGAVP